MNFYEKQCEIIKEHGHVTNMDSDTRAELCAACLDMDVSELLAFIPTHCEFENRIGGVDLWIDGYLKAQGFFEVNDDAEYRSSTDDRMPSRV